MTSMTTTGPMAQRRKVFGDLGNLGGHWDKVGKQELGSHCSQIVMNDGGRVSCAFL
jgi:hypothetical protein